MEFVGFLEKINSFEWLSTLTTLILKSNHNQHIVTQHILDHISHITNYPIIHIDASEYSLEDIQKRLSMTMLGQSYLYWIKNSPEWDSSKQKQLLQFLEQNDSTRKVLLTTELTLAIKQTESCCIVIIPEELNQKQAELLVQQLFPTKNYYWIQLLFQKLNKVSPDQLCMIREYVSKLGKEDQKYFFDYTFEKIVQPNHSLFTLSQHFFSGSKKLFFKEWRILKDTYPPEFWIVYWAEQVWQAVVFIEKARASNPQEARKFVNRLPFSFMQKDWNRISREQLIKGHSFLYEVDYSLKNGHGSLGIDLFVTKFIEETL